MATMPMPPTNLIRLALVAALLTSCSQTPRSLPAVRGKIVSPHETVDRIDWTANERSQKMASRTPPRRLTADMSAQVILLNAAETPHRHRTHDLVVVLLSGRVKMHIGERTVDILPGDVMEIPRGEVHWAENIADGGSEAYAIFTPPYDGKDVYPVEPSATP
jgi:mannose-6-phosphate isomerase-like protein (cupin superfamily)